MAFANIVVSVSHRLRFDTYTASQSYIDILFYKDKDECPPRNRDRHNCLMYPFLHIVHETRHRFVCTQSSLETQDLSCKPLCLGVRCLRFTPFYYKYAYERNFRSALWGPRAPWAKKLLAAWPSGAFPWRPCTPLLLRNRRGKPCRPAPSAASLWKNSAWKRLARWTWSFLP